MIDVPESLRDVDWRLTTWEGSRKEQLRRWSELPLAAIIASLEEMAELEAKLRGEGVGEGDTHRDMTSLAPLDGVRE